MRINKIRLSGFKSFVDPTNLEFPGNLSGIVGPNGCGKSNIIDAMLWVLGESSAKHLRGDSMADVIFNGSNTRKPVGQASVEIIFDNSDGKIGGQYAAYSEISIKRQVGRDGISSYSLNGVRCRRRDITHIFLGTGIGSRSYSVIEQGMISRVIEAKPEELRMFLEEAAGISKYKERRRETENRIRNTKDNIFRINDIISELDKQLQTLQRQARAAERYQQLKQEEREVREQLLALHWRALATQSESQSRVEGQCINAVEATTAALHATETEMVRQRENQTTAIERFNEVQNRFYTVGADLAKAEQNIQHAHERREALQNERAQTDKDIDETRNHLLLDHQKVAGLTVERDTLLPVQEELRVAEDRAQVETQAAEAAVQAWQARWDDHHQTTAGLGRSEQIEQTRSEHLRQGIDDARRRVSALRTEREGLDPDGLRAAIASLRSRFEERRTEHDRLMARRDATQSALRQSRELLHGSGMELDEARQLRQAVRGRIASLDALQQSALGMDRPAIREWMEKHGLSGQPRLAAALTVEPGWERAVEAVIGISLDSLCVGNLDDLLNVLPELKEGHVSALKSGMSMAEPAIAERADTLLAARVGSDLPLARFLGGVHAVETLDDARSLVSRLPSGESVVTRDGVWLGHDWVQANRDLGAQGGILARNQELKRLAIELQNLDARIAELERRVEVARAGVGREEQEDATIHEALSDSHQRLAAVKSEIAGQEARLDQIVRRSGQIDEELAELDDQIALDEGDLENCRLNLESACDQLTEAMREREQLVSARDGLRAAVQRAREAWRVARDRRHEDAVRLGRLNAELAGIEQAVLRYRTAIERLERRRTELGDAIRGFEEPLRQLQIERQDLLAQRLEVESALTQARAALQAIDSALRAIDQQRLAVEGELAARRDELEKARVESRTIAVRMANLCEQIETNGRRLDEVIAGIPDTAAEPVWEERLADIGRRVQRLGPINLAAIDECTALTERKGFLDRQFADLNEALATLEEAIRKIDRETRTRFKETFDKVNTGLQVIFPVLFGGGHAYLEQTGDDLLETGVAVMARPPGKRNSTIHLLSGGEKALTAVALVFAIFDLNPAPFCLLDEVDAPLDDANVVRLCEMLKARARDIQFLFITHNKITMEIAHQLIGVTMHEAGVSRLVAVNMEEAVQLAATA
jgi:chromosome segregation protein